MSKPAGTTIHLAEALAAWAVRLDPTAEDLDLAERALLDTMAVTLAARDHPLVQVARGLQDAARWASIGHVLDFDDLTLDVKAPRGSAGTARTTSMPYTRTGSCDRRRRRTAREETR